MKTKKLLLKSFFLFSIINTYGQQNYNGNWRWNNASSEFTINLKQQGNKITGSHCSVTNNGSKIDCADTNETTLNGTIQGDSVIIQFKSGFSTTKGTAIIQKINNNHIRWKIIQKPKGEFHIPGLVLMIKQ